MKKLLTGLLVLATLLLFGCKNPVDEKPESNKLSGIKATIEKTKDVVENNTSVFVAHIENNTDKRFSGEVLFVMDNTISSKRELVLIKVESLDPGAKMEVTSVTTLMLEYGYTAQVSGRLKEVNNLEAPVHYNRELFKSGINLINVHVEVDTKEEKVLHELIDFYCAKYTNISSIKFYLRNEKLEDNTSPYELGIYEFVNYYPATKELIFE